VPAFRLLCLSLLFAAGLGAAAAAAPWREETRHLSGLGLWLLEMEVDPARSHLDGAPAAAPGPGTTRTSVIGSRFTGRIEPDHYGPGRHKYFYSFPDLPAGPWTGSSNTHRSGYELARTDDPGHCGYLFDFCAGGLDGRRYATRSASLTVVPLLDLSWQGTEADPVGANPLDWRIEERHHVADLAAPGTTLSFFVGGFTRQAPPSLGPSGRTLAATPLPPGVALLGAAAAALALVRRRRGPAPRA
jgi:hypothetical protein